MSRWLPALFFYFFICVVGYVPAHAMVALQGYPDNYASTDIGSLHGYASTDAGSLDAVLT